MRANVRVKSVAAAIGMAAFLSSPVGASVLTPYDGTVASTNYISLNDIFTAEFNLNIGDWGGDPDAVFLIEATEDLGTITTDSVNPATESISNLTLQWNSSETGGAGTVLSGPLTITDAVGNVVPHGSLSLAFTSGFSAFLIAKADAVLKNLTNFDVRVEAVPVPPALLLFGSGIVGLGLLARRRKQKTGVGQVSLG